MATWTIDPGLAADVRALVGWDPDDGAAGLVAVSTGSIPIGSTAKREAVAAGVVPPGADPDVVARRIVDDRGAGRPTVTWSCWAMSTLMAALLESAGVGPATVAAVRRIDERAPAVDVHSVVLAEGLICDPYLAGVVGGPGSAEVVRDHGGVVSRRTDEPDGRWTFGVRTWRWATGLDYRVLAPAVDPGDVEALCAVSVSHSGAPSYPLAVLWRDGEGLDIKADPDGGAGVRRWRDGMTTTTDLSSWADAVAEFAADTGIALA